MTDEKIRAIRAIYDRGYTLAAANDIPWMLDEIVRLRAEAKRADEEATTLANSDLATTEQVVRALRAENERLRDALHDIREWSKPEHVLRFDDGDVTLSYFITDAIASAEYVADYITNTEKP